MRLGWSWAGALIALAIASGPTGARAEADAYPDRPVRIISDSAPGSANDVTARILADQLGTIWKQSVIVINAPGASGGIAARQASTALPDGYTLFMPAASVFLALKGAPGVAANLPVELPRDFVPAGFVTRQPMFICASPKLGVSTIPELIALAKSKPQQISYASTGRGRITDLTMRLLQQRADIVMPLVAYSGGPTAAMPDVSDGRVGVILEAYSGLAAAMDGGLVRRLAVASPKRLPEFPDLPTVAETLPGFTAGGWELIVAPIGTPDAIVRKVASGVNAALSDKTVVARLSALGSYVDHMTPDEVLAYADSQQKTWAPILEQVAREAP